MESPRFGLSGSGKMSSIPVPVSDVPLHPHPNRGLSRNQSSLNSYGQDNEGYGGRPGMLSRNSSQAVDRGSSNLDSSLNGYADEDDVQDDSPEKGNGGGEKRVTMSLMALLAETDEEMGLDGSKYMMDDDDGSHEEEEMTDKEKFSNCSVCMVRHHGDAFAACGHTFCRLCSRELSVERGNCPLCNNFILEILHVF